MRQQIERYTIDRDGDTIHYRPFDLYDMTEVPAVETTTKWIANDYVGALRVFTCFLGIDMNYGAGDPLILETVVFKYNWRGVRTVLWVARYSTTEEARAGHAAACARARWVLRIQLSSYVGLFVAVWREAGPYYKRWMDAYRNKCDTPPYP